jgi:uncharacterized integral membrane protein
MLALIFTVIFSIFIGYFATQNTSALTIHFWSYSWSGIPMYLIVLISLLVGLLFAWMFNLLTVISSSLTIKGKDQALLKAKNDNLELIKKVHQLELENTKLAAKEGVDLVEDNSL